jgi:hypothetical protein
MPKRDREVQGLAEAADKLAAAGESDGAPPTDEELDNLASYLRELEALPGIHCIAEQAELSRRFAGLPMASIDTILHELADEERAAKRRDEATAVQPPADRFATGEPGAALPTVEPPPSDEPMSTVVVKPEREPPRAPLRLYAAPHAQQWPSVGGGLFVGDQKRPTTVDGTPIEPRLRPQEPDV